MDVVGHQGAVPFSFSFVSRAKREEGVSVCVCAQMQLAILLSLQLCYRMRDIFEVAEIRFKLVTELQISVCACVCV